ncbi:MAG: hypothetical protein ACTSVB_05525 [Candidatus Heimdallarchaeaceae archaeon]
MANDIDMWQDIKELEKAGKKEQANDLLKIFHQKFIKGNIKKAEKLKEKYIKKYGWIDSYW